MTTPTATIYLPWHALDDAIQRGSRAAQPAASAVVPGTLYCVTDEGAKVERSSGTTWQVYSPTPGGGGAGTGDVVGPGVATDDAIALYDGTTGKLIQDSGQTISGLTASITSSILPVDLAMETTGTLPDARLSANVPLLNAANQFTGASQQIGPAANARLSFVDTAPPADARVFRIMDSVQVLEFGALNDAQTVVLGSPLTLTRAGDARIGRDVYEKGRTTPMGHWVDVPYSASNFSALGGGTWTVGSAAIIHNRYTRIGKTLTWALYLSWFSGANTVAGSVTTLVLAVPGPSTINGPQRALVAYGHDGGARADLDVESNGLTVNVTKRAGGTFAAGAPGLITTWTFEVL